MAAKVEKLSNLGKNRRPRLPSSLLHDSPAYLEWAFRNSGKSRCYLTNLPTVLSAYRSVVGDLSSLRPYMAQASEVIAREQGAWRGDYPSKYPPPSAIHMNSYRVADAKKFDLCATIIVGLELACVDRGVPVNVYDLVRIVAAFYFIDLFDLAKLDQIKAAYAAMPADERRQKFGGDMVEATFERLCYSRLMQHQIVIERMAEGQLATWSVCEGLVRLAQEIDPGCHLGSVLGVGQNMATHGGKRAVAEGLNVVTTVDIGDLKPCF